MLGFFKRKRSKLEPEVYMAETRTALICDGFDPKWLSELLPHPEGIKLERFFTMLRKRGLEPAEAAKAIGLGTHFYNQKKGKAGEGDWPLQYTDKVPEDYSRQECYYLEQMVDAATAVIKNRKKA
ncbi:MAG: hypothetical protein RQ824_09800 [bacterium]|nr:hypothetical protein [bacterium]